MAVNVRSPGDTGERIHDAGLTLRLRHLSRAGAADRDEQDQRRILAVRQAIQPHHQLPAFAADGNPRLGRAAERQARHRP